MNTRSWTCHSFGPLRVITKFENVSDQDVIVKYVSLIFFLLFILYKINYPGRQIQ